jgi:hypothetical protein
MSLDPKTPSPVEGPNEGKFPTPVSTLLQLRYAISQPVFAAFLAGGVAGAVSRTVVSPLERLKILFQIQSGGTNEYNQSVRKGLMKMWKDEGWRGFMRGNGTNCIRIVPYSAVQFGSYNFYKRVREPLHCKSPAKLSSEEIDRFQTDHFLCSLLSRTLVQTSPQ